MPARYGDSAHQLHGGRYDHADFGGAARDNQPGEYQRYHSPELHRKQGPVVEINDNGFGGLQFNTGSAGSALRSLAIDNSGSDGVTLNDSNILVAGNLYRLGTGRVDGRRQRGKRHGDQLLFQRQHHRRHGGRGPQYRHLAGLQRHLGQHRQWDRDSWFVGQHDRRELHRDRCHRPRRPRQRQ